MTLAATTQANPPASNGDRYVAAASAQSSWQTINSAIGTANTASLLRPALSTGGSNIVPLTIPFGVTRALFRVAALSGSATAITYTTQPVFRFLVTDANGAPTRVDNADISASGLLAACSNATAATNSDDTARYFNPLGSSLTGYDLLGGSTLYGLVETAAAGANFTTCVLQALFLN